MEEIRNQAFAACARFDQELEAYLEGESRPFIISHSAACEGCGALLGDLISVREAARNLPWEEPSSALWGRVHAGLEAESAAATAVCREFGAGLQAYLEGEARPLISAHAQDCAPCGALLADLQAIRQAARELPQLEPSPALWSNVHAHLEAEGAFAEAACGRFAEEMEPFMEGEARPFIAEHARDCAACRGLLGDLQTIQKTARELPLVEPSPAVWANVRARLEAEGAFRVPVSGWRQLLAWRLFPHAAPLAMMGAMIFLGVLLSLPTTSLRRGGGAEEASALSGARMAVAPPNGEDGALAHVVSDLESSFKANEASMAPDLKATYEKSLVSLDGSIRECLDSLQHEPRNTLAQDYLLTAYTRKAEVLSSALEFEGR